MAKISYRLKKSKENASIYARFTIGSKQIERKTGLTVEPSQWKNGLPKGNNPETKNKKTLLQKLALFIDKEHDNTIEKGETINGEWLQLQIDLFFGRVNDKGDAPTKIIDHIKSIVATAHTRENSKGNIGISKSRTKAYSRLAELFNEFQKRKNLNIEEVDKIQFDKFRMWLLDKKRYSPSYAYKKVSDLKIVCKDARAKGITVAKDLDAVKTRNMSAYDEEMDVVYLTEKEILKIESLLLTRQSLLNARKWLVLACYTGQRGGDLMEYVKEENFIPYKGRFILSFTQKKTNKKVEIPVLPKVEKIYKERLPYPISTVKLNMHLKELGKLAGIDTPTMGRKREKGNGKNAKGVKRIRPKWEYITTHIGRRTFATLHYGKLPTAIIMKATGHSTENTFLGYINKSDNSHLDTWFDYYDQKERTTMRVVQNDNKAVNE